MEDSVRNFLAYDESVNENEVYDEYSRADLGQLDVQMPKKRGRPRKYAPAGTPASSPNVGYGKQTLRLFNGKILVYHCPYAHCHRFYPSKLARARHEIIYDHINTCDDIDINVLTTGVDPTAQKMALVQSVLRVYKCPLLGCEERFSDIYSLCEHFSASHCPVNNPSVPGLKIRNGKPVHDLSEWTNGYDDCLENALVAKPDTESLIPELYNISDEKRGWSLLSIFKCIGPNPRKKRVQTMNRLRAELARTYTITSGNVLMVTEDASELLFIVAMFDLMSKGFMLTRDCPPITPEDSLSGSDYNPVCDEEFMKMISQESVIATINSLNSPPKKHKDKKEELADCEFLDGDADILICQVPGCYRRFSSYPAYKYHANYFEHNLQLLLESSPSIRTAIFNMDGPLDAGNRGELNWHGYDKIQLRFVSGRYNSSASGDGAERVQPAEPRLCPPIDRRYAIIDGVHILHRHIDQRLPTSWGFSAMKRSEENNVNQITGEFSLFLKKNESVSMFRREMTPAGKKRRVYTIKNGIDFCESKKKDLLQLAPPFQYNKITHLGVEIWLLDNAQIQKYQKEWIITTVSTTFAEDGVKAWLDCSSIRSYDEEESLPSLKMERAPQVVFSMPEVEQRLTANEFSCHQITSTSSLLFNDGSRIQAIDWFPYVHVLSEKKFILALASVSKGEPQEVEKRQDAILIWNVLVEYQDDGSATIGQCRLNKILKPKPCAISSIKWCPRVHMASNNVEEINGNLAVLLERGYIHIYTLPKHAIFSFSDTLSGQSIISIRPVCKISISFYTITSFCWSRQPGGAVGCYANGSQENRILFGTKEGYFGVCDLAIPNSPQVLMLAPGHEQSVTAVDTSPRNPNSLVTSSSDGCVVLWDLGNPLNNSILLNSGDRDIQAQWAPAPSHIPEHHGSSQTKKQDVDPGTWNAENYLFVSNGCFRNTLINIKDPEYSIVLDGQRVSMSIYCNDAKSGMLIAAVEPDGSLVLHGYQNPLCAECDAEFLANISYDSTENVLKVSAPQGPSMQRNQIQSISWHPIPLGVFAASIEGGFIYINLIRPSYLNRECDPHENA